MADALLHLCAVSAMQSKYTPAILAPLFASARSYHQVLQGLGLKITGGSQGRLKKLALEYGIDTSHFLGQAHGRGCASPARLGAAVVLVRHRNGPGVREHPRRLRRALIDSGTPEECKFCGLGSEWNHRPLRLQIDHKNGDFADNRKRNLRFLCPNCHSQTWSFGRGNAAVVDLVDTQP